MRRLTKIRYADKTVTIGYETHEDGLRSTGEVVSETEPSPEFQAALKSLTPFIAKICDPVLVAAEIEGSEDEERDPRATVTGISVSYKMEDKPGYIIKAKVKVNGANGPLNIATPLIVQPDEDSGEFEYREELFEALRAVVTHAEAYLEGARAQAELFPTEQTTRRRQSNGSGKPAAQTTTTDELEAKRRDRSTREHEIDRALLDIVQIEPDAFLNSRRKPMNIVADRVHDRFEGYAYRDESGKEWDGVHRHTTEAGAVVWCGVVVTGKSARFWYDVQPDAWDDATSAPTLIGEVLVARVLRAYGTAAQEPAGRTWRR